jgi:hypothetical protein
VKAGPQKRGFDPGCPREKKQPSNQGLLQRPQHHAAGVEGRANEEFLVFIFGILTKTEQQTGQNRPIPIPKFRPKIDQPRQLIDYKRDPRFHWSQKTGDAPPLF